MLRKTKKQILLKYTSLSIKERKKERKKWWLFLFVCVFVSYGICPLWTQSDFKLFGNVTIPCLSWLHRMQSENISEVNEYSGILKAEV